LAEPVSVSCMATCLVVGAAELTVGTKTSATNCLAACGVAETGFSISSGASPGPCVGAICDCFDRAIKSATISHCGAAAICPLSRLGRQHMTRCSPTTASGFPPGVTAGSASSGQFKNCWHTLVSLAE